MVPDKIDQARQKYMELLQVKIGERIETLLNSPAAKETYCCGPVCDATYLGLILRKLTENEVSYSISVPSRSSKSYNPFVTVSFKNLSPTSINSMVNEWELEPPSCGYNHGCENETSPFWGDATCETRNLPISR